jgi:GTP-binding protein HflX
MHKTEKETERVVLVGVEMFENNKTFALSMDELASLAVTAGAEVVDTFTQSRDRLDTKTQVGKGKLEEIKTAIEADDINTVIFNERLTPRQNSNLEDILGVKVIDRMQLILDIFAMRARSHEGMLQVELAQLNYMLPRLVGKGIALSRQAGGIGSRGPGESQLELDRRNIRTRIEVIEKQLKKTEQTRENLRQKRQNSGVFRIGLIGYTNAGKSSIFNAMTRKEQYEKDELFATLDATTKDFVIAGDFKVTLTDTVGFIQDLPTELVKAFKSTLEESANVDLLIHVIDASNPDHAIHEQTVHDIMKDIDVANIPMMTVYNKADLAQNFIPTETPFSLISIKDENGPAALRHAIVAKMKEMFVKFDIKLPFEKAYELYNIKQSAIVERILEVDETYVVEGYIPRDQVWKVEGYEHI